MTGCNIYNPPLRPWDFDPAFLTAAELPPLTPRVVAVEQYLLHRELPLAMVGLTVQIEGGVIVPTRTLPATA